MCILAADIGGIRAHLLSRHGRIGLELLFCAAGLPGSARIAARLSGQVG